jgi:dipeptidyl aminopeptidase/acylaminoacyl peptidase
MCRAPPARGAEPGLTPLAEARRGVARLTRPLLHRALLRGLRPARLRHEAPLDRRPAAGAGLHVLQLVGARGQRLAAWLALPTQASAGQPVPAVVAVHGWGANASTLWPVVDPLRAAGIAVLLFDAAAHGQSSDEDFSSLPRFAEDVAAALAWLHTDTRIDAQRLALLGHSVGAAAVLLHGARRGGVKAIVSLSAFAHPRELMERWLREHHIPRRWIGSAILEHVQATIGERFERIAPVNVAPDIDCPVLLVHGARDTTVPLDDAQRLHAALHDGELLVVDGEHDLRAALQPHAPRIVGFLSARLAPRLA